MRGAPADIPCLHAALVLEGDLSTTGAADPMAAIKSCRPFIDFGALATPGRYPHVSDMRIENQWMIAGCFLPRSGRDRLNLFGAVNSGVSGTGASSNFALGYGDGPHIGERRP